MPSETLPLPVFEQVAGLAVEGATQEGERVGFDDAGHFGFGEVVAGRHREARELGESVGGDPLRIQQLGEVPAQWHGRKVAPNVTLDNSKVAAYASLVTGHGE